MAVSIQVLAKNPFNSLLSFKQQNALRGLVTARCSVLALRSKQVKFLHFLVLPWASIGRRLTPELWARVVIAGLGSALMPWHEASEMVPWVSVGNTPRMCSWEQFVTLLPFSPEVESRSNLLSQERAQELLFWCQRDSPNIKHTIFTAKIDLANPPPCHSRIGVLLQSELPLPGRAGWHAWGLVNMVSTLQPSLKLSAGFKNSMWLLVYAFRLNYIIYV